MGLPPDCAFPNFSAAVVVTLRAAALRCRFMQEMSLFYGKIIEVVQWIDLLLEGTTPLKGGRLALVARSVDRHEPELDIRIVQGDHVVAAAMAQIGADSVEICCRLTEIRDELLQLLPQPTCSRMARRDGRRSDRRRHHRRRNTVNRVRAGSTEVPDRVLVDVVGALSQELKAIIAAAHRLSDEMAHRLAAAAAIYRGA